MTRSSVLFATGAMLLLASGCGPTTRREALAQWAVAAAATSQPSGTGTDFSPQHAAGAPDVGACGDNPNAWSPALANPGVTGADDYLDLTYDRYVYVKEVDIYQSYNPGAVVEVDLMAEDGSTSPVIYWQDPAGDPNGNPSTTCPTAIDVFAIQSNDPGGTPDQFNQIRIYLDEDLIGDRNGINGGADDFAELDAVQLYGDELVNR